MKMKQMMAAIMAGTMVTMSFIPTNAEEHEPVTLTIVHEHSEEAAQSIPSSAAFRYCMELYKEAHPWVTLKKPLLRILIFRISIQH